MSVNIDVKVDPRFKTLTKALRAHDDKALNRKFRAAVRTAVAPIAEGVKAEIPPVMPRGYEAVLLGAIRIRTSISGKGVSVVAVAKGKSERRDLPALDKGVLAHPLYGNRKRWYRQRIQAGFFTRPAQAGMANAVRGVEAATDDVVRTLGGA